MCGSVFLVLKIIKISNYQFAFDKGTKFSNPSNFHVYHVNFTYIYDIIIIKKPVICSEQNIVKQIATSFEHVTKNICAFCPGHTNVCIHTHITIKIKVINKYVLSSLKTV